jgi:putative SOS response-associated peptidase YedK
MCNYLGYIVTADELIMLRKIEKEFSVDVALDVLRSGFEYDNWRIIVATPDKMDWEERTMHWEFIPWWVKNWDEVKAARKQGIPWLNATAEKLLQSKMFREAALKRRCLVPAHHFYEWRWYKPDWSKKDLAYPYVISMKDHARFFMAGIWQPWTDKETGEMIDTFAVVTTAANPLMQQVHNKKKRQPTILPIELAEEWIFDELGETRIQELASYQLSADQMKAITIRKDFREMEDPTMEFIYEELPALVL